jgi:hypothetical protein
MKFRWIILSEIASEGESFVFAWPIKRLDNPT